MFEWLMGWGGPFGLPSMRDIISIPDRYRQLIKERRDAEIQREIDLEKLYKEQREGLIPSRPRSSRDAGMHQTIDEEMRKWYLQEKLRQTGRGATP